MRFWAGMRRRCWGCRAGGGWGDWGFPMGLRPGTPPGTPEPELLWVENVKLRPGRPRGRPHPNPPPEGEGILGLIGLVGVLWF